MPVLASLCKEGDFRGSIRMLTVIKRQCEDGGPRLTTELNVEVQLIF